MKQPQILTRADWNLVNARLAAAESKLQAVREILGEHRVSYDTRVDASLVLLCPNRTRKESVNYDSDPEPRDQLHSLRAELAAVTAERDEWKQLHANQMDEPDGSERELAETKAALETLRGLHEGTKASAEAGRKHHADDLRLAMAALEASRAETAAAQARIERLEGLFQNTHGVHVSWVAKATETEAALAALLGRIAELESALQQTQAERDAWRDRCEPVRF
jgi:chromosome segregation ATPase